MHNHSGEPEEGLIPSHSINLLPRWPQAWILEICWKCWWLEDDFDIEPLCWPHLLGWMWRDGAREAKAQGTPLEYSGWDTINQVLEIK